MLLIWVENILLACGWFFIMTRMAVNSFKVRQLESGERASSPGVFGRVGRDQAKHQALVPQVRAGLHFITPGVEGMKQCLHLDHDGGGGLADGVPGSHLNLIISNRNNMPLALFLEAENS